MTPHVAVERVSVRFLLDRHRRLVSPALAHLRRPAAVVTALEDVDLEVAPGSGVALLGASGAGKTTLLRVVAGVVPQDAGRVEVRGRIASLLAVDGGLMPELSGRDNALLLAVLAGLSRAQARRSLDRVRIRSELGEAFERPVSSYSQGMVARLGYAAAELADPDVLLLDEVHEAMDHAFRGVVEQDARELLDRGGVVIATGHDLPLLERLCPRAVLLEHGRVVADGEFDEVRDRYLADWADALPRT